MGAHSDIGSGCGEDKFQKAHDLIKKMQERGVHYREQTGCTRAEVQNGKCPTLMNQYLDMKRTGLDNQGMPDDKDRTILFNPKIKDEQIQINNYLAWIKTNYGTTLTTSLKAQ